MSKEESGTGWLATLPLARDGLKKFIAEASPAQILKLADLLKETREVEQRAALAVEVIDGNQKLAESAMDLRHQVLDEVRRVVDQSDQIIQAILERLKTERDPEVLAQLTRALAVAATSDKLSALGQTMAGIKTDKVDLEF